MRTRSFELALILLTSVAIGRSQSAPAAPVAAQTPPVAVAPTAAADTPAVVAKPADAAQGAEAAAAGATRNKDTLSVDFPDEDIRTILRNVADLFELNLVIPDTLQGKSSIKLHDVTWRQIFEVVLTPVGYTYVDEAGIIKVVSLDSLNQEPVATEIFVLSYARASDVQPAIVTMIEGGKGGKLTVDARSNALIVTERPSKLNKIRPIIKQLDRATDQVMIETKFIEVTDTDVKNLGVNWASLQNYSMMLGNLQQQITASSIPNAFYNLVNRPGSDLNGGVHALSSGTTGVASPASVLSLKDPTGSITVPASAVFSAQDFTVILSALQSLSTTKIVSNPTIVTLNNTEATINVGEEDPIPNYTYNQERGSFEVSGFTYKPIGIILKVTPQVNASGFIKLTLAPEVSQKAGTVSFGGAGGAQIPVISERRATTQVTLKDGFTMGIGGLRSSTSTKGSSKVPFLGSIPVLGQLFRSDSKDIQTTNLIIFITARTVNAEGAALNEVFDPRQVRDMGVRRDDLPGFRDGSDPFLPLVGTKEK
jgi:type IV pilus assembly protein PilQ